MSSFDSLEEEILVQSFQIMVKVLEEDEDFDQDLSRFSKILESLETILGSQ